MENSAVLAGRPEHAARAWRQSASLAARHDMPYDRALALEALATALPVGDPERRRGLERALTLLEPLGATEDATRVRALFAAAGSAAAG